MHRPALQPYIISQEMKYEMNSPMVVECQSARAEISARWLQVVPKIPEILTVLNCLVVAFSCCLPMQTCPRYVVRLIGHNDCGDLFLALA